MSEPDTGQVARRLGLPVDDPQVNAAIERLAKGQSLRSPIDVRRANRLSVFALFCAFINPVLGIAFGWVARQEIKASGGRERGMEFANWAIMIGVVYLLVALAVAGAVVDAGR